MAARPIGTLTKKTHRQSTAATSTPPRIGPPAAATPATPPQTPIALARARGSGYAARSRASDAGTRQCRAHALHDPGRDQHAEVRRQPASERGHHERRQPDLEDAPRAQSVGEGAAGQEQGRQHQQVAVDHPLQATDSRAEVRAQRRKGDVHDRGVKDDHEVAQTHCDQRTGRQSLRDRRRGASSLLSDPTWSVAATYYGWFTGPLGHQVTRGPHESSPPPLPPGGSAGLRQLRRDRLIPKGFPGGAAG